LRALREAKKSQNSMIALAFILVLTFCTLRRTNI